jgi:solute carrier family 25 2-oxodicarboxylate transporter 21
LKERKREREIKRENMANQSVPAVEQKRKAKPLPFRYQFAAGAVAGVSEILVM